MMAVTNWQNIHLSLHLATESLPVMATAPIADRTLVPDQSTDLRPCHRPRVQRQFTEPSAFTGSPKLTLRAAVQPFDPADPRLIANPFPTFAQLRQHDPVHLSKPLGGWLLTRYEDVKLACSDRRFSADRIGPFFRRLEDGQHRYGQLEKLLGGWAVFTDPPRHTRLRALLNRAFAPRVVEGLRGQIEELVERLLDATPSDGGLDLIAELAYPLPALVIMLLLGVPTEDLERVKHWSDELALFVGSSQRSEGKYVRAEQAIGEMADYFRRLVTEHHRTGRPDLLGELIAVRDAGDKLSDDELLSTAILLLFAGHETTTNLIGNGMLALAGAPAAWDALRREPALVESAVEELLRYDGPSGAVVRVVSEDVQLGGRTMRAGQRVFAMVNAANRDPDVFDDPERIDLARANNRHLAFGHGIHFCLGAPLARLEANIVFTAMSRRWTRIELAAEELVWSDSLVLRGVKSLPLTVRA